MGVQETLESVSTPKMERRIIIRRFFRFSDEIDRLSQRIETKFDVDDVPKDSDEVEKFLESLSDKEEFYRAIDGIELKYEPHTFPWFKGNHYHVGVEDGKCVVYQDKDEKFLSKVRNRVHKVAVDPEVAALLRGIIASGLGARETMFRGGWNEVTGSGSVYYEEGDLYPTKSFSKVNAIPGVETSKTGSGRSFKMAAEIAPIVWNELDKVEEEQEEPLPAPEPQVPEEIAKRKRKFTEIFEQIELTDEDVEEFKEILENHDALEYWKDYIAPGIKYRPKVKKAVLCMLASPEDKHGTKGRTNCIFYGPPGTGKTAFKTFLVEKFGAYSEDGSRVSRADLTYNKATNEPGLLVRAHKGLAVIEEADKMEGKPLEAALTAFGESGKVEIRNMNLPAEVRGILLSNFESKRQIRMKWGKPVFNRFEFVLEFNKLEEDELNDTLDWHYRFFRKKKPGEDASYLKKYLKWVRNFEPEIDELKEIQEYKKEHIDEIENVRKGISVMNVAYTIARLNHRNVLLEDFKQALDLVTM